MDGGAPGPTCSRAVSWYPFWIPEPQDPHHTPYMDATRPCTHPRASQLANPYPGWDSEVLVLTSILRASQNAGLSWVQNIEADVDTSHLDARTLRLVMQDLSQQDFQGGSVMLWITPHSDAHL